METVETGIINTLLPIVVVFMMFSMGLDLTIADFVRALKEKKSVLIAMTGQYLLAPALAFLLVFLFAPAPYIALGLIIVIAIPGGSISNAFVYVGRGNVSLSVTLTGISQFLGLISVPFLIGLGITLYYPNVGNIELPVARTILVLLALSLLPMGIGMFVRHRWINFAQWLEPRTRSLSVFALFAACALAVAPNFQNSVSQLPQAGLLAVLMCVFGNIAGVIIARLSGLNLEDAFTIGIEISMQNLALAVLIATTMLGKSELALYAGVYSLISPAIAGIAVIAFNIFRKKGGHLAVS